MRLHEVIKNADNLKPNVFSNEVKTAWINEIEGTVQLEVLLLNIVDVKQYDYSQDVELIVAPPHDKLYLYYLLAMIDFAHGEYSNYSNTMEMFNQKYKEYQRWYAMRYRPADGRMENYGYYLSAYAIAVKHGFVGSEEKWLETLHGATGATGAQGIRGEQGKPGLNGVALAADGIYAFNVDENGHLILSYTGDDVPNFEINESGHLILTV